MARRENPEQIATLHSDLHTLRFLLSAHANTLADANEFGLAQRVLDVERALLGIDWKALQELCALHTPSQNSNGRKQ